MNFNEAEQVEVRRILKMAQTAPPSTGALGVKMRCSPASKGVNQCKASENRCAE
jgi:hypothetical protein